MLDRLEPLFETHTVGGLVPAGYAACARVFHRVPRDGDGGERWADVAARNRRVAHGAMQFAAISVPPGAPPNPHAAEDAGVEAHLTAHEASALARVLGQHTGTPDDVLFAVWEGYAPMQRRAGPMLELPGRRYHLLRGPLEMVTAFRSRLDLDGPNMWWPRDRAWFVAGDVDLPCTYVGGDDAAVRAVLAHPALEALRCDRADGITVYSDPVNT